MVYEKLFNGNGDEFSAKYEAEKWLRENGYSVGSSSIDGPQGVVKGDAYISKWRNMTKREQNEMDGVLYAGREGVARLLLKQAPDNGIA
ncbi:hypothetical protein [Marinobacterium sp. BA1]|uniref:hypothetical protein n=1 Tax=Marinobacterium sp. BA1 TaxID=3138931 RepID=UPI0032E57F39